MRRNPRRTLNEQLDVLVGDIHFGSEDPLALEVYYKAIEHLKPRRIFQLGDMKDCLPFSSHLPLRVHQDYDWLNEEIIPAEQFVRKSLTHCGRMHLLGGNHEFWLERWAAGGGAAAEQLWPVIDPANITKVDPRRVTYTPYVNDHDLTAHVEIAPNLIAVHGWTAAKQAASIHLARASMAGWSIAFGHTHRHQEDSARCPRTGFPIISFNVACLCSLNPRYTQFNGPTMWTQGLGFVYHSKKNPMDWTHYVPYIHKGRLILPDGHEIRA